MAITVKYFAAIREQIGRAEDIVEFSEGLSVPEVWSNANNGQSMPEKIMIAVNMQHEKADVILSDGDEVAFFPTVTGG